MMSETMIEAEAIRKAYRTGSDTIEVLAGVDLTVRRGECVFLLGPSGSGKSTLLSILGCVLSPDSGVLRLAGQDVTNLEAHERATFRRERIGFVFQRFHLFAGLTALDNVRVPLDLISRPAKAAIEEAERLLNSVGLASKVNAPIGQLSMGQRQRVAIARALAANPDLIFADEPTASLDAHSGRTTAELVRSLATEQRKTVIVVTHDSRILQFADRILHLKDGRIGAESSPGVVGNTDPLAAAGYDDAHL
jgi:putative ABC transport system ATP-binding protein